MKRALNLSSLVALLFVSGLSLAAETDSGPPAVSKSAVSLETRKQLDRYRDDHVQSVRTGHYENIAAYYTDGVRFMAEFQMTMIGRANALTYHQAFSARFEVNEYQRTLTEVLDLSDQVVEIGSFHLALTHRAEGRTRELTGKYLEIWMKQPSGKLALLTSAWNYNHPVDFAEELRFSAVPTVRIALQPHLLVRDRISFELAAYNRLLETTVAQGDAVVWSQYYADDAVLLHSFHSPMVGRAAIDSFLQGHVKQLPVFEHLDVRNDRIDDLGGYVIEYASHIANWRNGESSGVGTGKNIRIWRREPDHALRMVRSIGMYD